MDRSDLYEAERLVAELRRTIPTPGRGCSVEELDRIADMIEEMIEMSNQFGRQS